MVSRFGISFSSGTGRVDSSDDFDGVLECSGLTPEQLYEQGRAFDLVTSKTIDTTWGSESSSIRPRFPDAIRCSESNVIFWKTDNLRYNSLLRDGTTLPPSLNFDGDGNDVAAFSDAFTTGCRQLPIITLYQSGRAFNLVSSKQPDPLGLTTMFPNWPDALRCSDNGAIYYVQSRRNNSVIYQAPRRRPDRDGREELIFRESDQSFIRHNIVNEDSPQSPTLCENRSIEQLYNQGKAFNLKDPSEGTNSLLFDYTFVDFDFQSPEASSLQTERRSSTSGGRIVNCADGVTTDNALSLALAIGNAQSLTYAQSLTQTSSVGLSIGVSVTATAEAGAIFASASVSATAGFEISTSYEVSSTTEQSQTLEKTEEVTLELQTTVSAAPNTCAQYAIVSSVTAEPVTVPYTATAQLLVYPRDSETGTPQNKPITDIPTLRNIRDFFPASFNAVLDESRGMISFPVSGEYSGTYFTEQDTVVSNCDACGMATIPTAVPNTAPNTAPNTTSNNALGDTSSVDSTGGHWSIGLLLAVVTAFLLRT